MCLIFAFSSFETSNFQCNRQICASSNTHHSNDCSQQCSQNTLNYIWCVLICKMWLQIHTREFHRIRTRDFILLENRALHSTQTRILTQWQHQAASNGQMYFFVIFHVLTCEIGTFYNLFCVVVFDAPNFRSTITLNCNRKHNRSHDNDVCIHFRPMILGVEVFKCNRCALSLSIFLFFMCFLFSAVCHNTSNCRTHRAHTM